jgi:hypothetical protein
MPLTNSADVNLFPEADIVNPALTVLLTKLLRRNKSTLSYISVLTTLLSSRATAGKISRDRKWSDYYTSSGGNSGEGGACGVVRNGFLLRRSEAAVGVQFNDFLDASALNGAFAAGARDIRWGGGGQVPRGDQGRLIPWGDVFPKKGQGDMSRGQGNY